MVRGPFRLLLPCALLVAPGSALARSSLTIEPVNGLALTAFTHNKRPATTERMKLTNPSVEGLVAPPKFTLQRDGSDLTGKRARLVVPVGDGTRLIASSGKVQRRVRPGDQAGAVGVGSLGRLESGKQLGAGLERRIGPIDFGAHYQFTRIKGGAIDPTGAVSESGAERMAGFAASGMAADVPDVDSRQRGHSLQATARIRF